ncbi:kinetochore protein Ndc80 [Reticulomyxa filosa]|uniref:Kinetochore protein Ndc80 n=1 Tax=Reticulomyxa filosa TaxID=46433 RepID=X6NVP1_RETFI|nr:kinetochore protein Ndc80 [Reticulomyxa filosa]|eukprot:ETO29864.1 kinetochore protein Ndc80 [Reticulomyxa filosa]
MREKNNNNNKTKKKKGIARVVSTAANVNGNASAPTTRSSIAANGAPSNPNASFISSSTSTSNNGNNTNLGSISSSNLNNVNSGVNSNVVTTNPIPFVISSVHDISAVDIPEIQRIHTRTHTTYNKKKKQALPPPGPRVFVGPRPNKDTKPNIDLDLGMDFHGLMPNQVMSVAEYLQHIGFDDLQKTMTVMQIRREFYIKMGFSKRNLLLDVPRAIQRFIMSYLETRSFLRTCITCSDLASFLDDPYIWRILVLYTAKVQGTLHETFVLRHRGWKATCLTMNKIDKDPRYYDHVWNVVVAGDVKVGQERLVVTLGKHWRCRLTNIEPVVSAVNGTYRFGIDFVVRRVVMKELVIKLQVWDGGNVMADAQLLQSVHIFLVLFDVTNQESYNRVSSVVRAMMELVRNAF